MLSLSAHQNCPVRNISLPFALYDIIPTLGRCRDNHADGVPKSAQWHCCLGIFCSFVFGLSMRYIVLCVINPNFILSSICWKGIKWHPCQNRMPLNYHAIILSRISSPLAHWLDTHSATSHVIRDKNRALEGAILVPYQSARYTACKVMCSWTFLMKKNKLVYCLILTGS